MTEKPILITRAETAALLSVSIDTVRRWTSAGRMPKPIHIKSVIRYHAPTIEAWALEGCPHCARAGWRPSGNGA